MAQITTGIRSILSHAAIYNFVQLILGAEKARRILVQDFFPKAFTFRMLDIGCGTAEILRHLPKGIHYTGFDASETYIHQAQKRFGQRGDFYAERITKKTLPHLGSFDLILAFGLLHHLSDDEALALFETAHQVLASGGRLLTIDPCFMSDQHDLARWLICKDRGQNIRTPEQYAALANRHFSHVKSTVRQDMLYIPYTHLILECGKP